MSSPSSSFGNATIASTSARSGTDIVPTACVSGSGVARIKVKVIITALIAPKPNDIKYLRP